MSARTRVVLVVAAAAVAAAATTVAVVALTRGDAAGQAGEPPPLFLDFGVRTDDEAQTLRRAVRLYDDGRLDDARELFARYDSAEARVGFAFAAWPDTLSRLRTLGDSALVRLHSAVVLAAFGREREARAELLAAKRVDPDTSYAVRADDFLHPRFVPGLPLFVPSRPYPPRLAQLPPAEQLAALERDGTVAGRLRYGAALQRLGRPLSARRAFDEAVALAPDDPEPLAGAAVARFDKDRPADAFARLGPLSRRFPRAQTVRFHLGILLLWIGDAPNARRQLQKARELGAQTHLGRQAKRFLDRL